LLSRIVTWICYQNVITPAIFSASEFTSSLIVNQGLILHEIALCISQPYALRMAREICAQKCLISIIYKHGNIIQMLNTTLRKGQKLNFPPH